MSKNHGLTLDDLEEFNRLAILLPLEPWELDAKIFEIKQHEVWVALSKTSHMRECFRLLDWYAGRSGEIGLKCDFRNVQFVSLVSQVYSDYLKLLSGDYAPIVITYAERNQALKFIDDFRAKIISIKVFKYFATAHSVISELDDLRDRIVESNNFRRKTRATNANAIILQLSKELTALYGSDENSCPKLIQKILQIIGAGKLDDRHINSVISQFKK